MAESTGNGVMNRQTASRIIPPRAQDLLVSFGSGLSANQWAVGDIAWELMEENRDRMPRAVVDAAIGLFAGLSSDRVADMRSVSAFYPAGVCMVCGTGLDVDEDNWCPLCKAHSTDAREAYGVLTYSHFRAAKSCGVFRDALKWLQTCIDTMDQFGGVPMPVDKLRALMSESGANDDTPLWVKRMRYVVNTLERLWNSGDTPDEIVRFCEEALSTAEERFGEDPDYRVIYGEKGSEKRDENTGEKEATNSGLKKEESDE